MNKKFYITLAAVAVLVSGFLLLQVLGGNSQAALPRDCDNNSIIYCGGITPSELSQKYNQNKTGDLPAVYSAYGISSSEIHNTASVAKTGAVHKDGRVTVNGQTVATGALSIGRQAKNGSAPKVIGGKTYHESPPSTSFRSDSIVAYVYFHANGQFKAAIITSCGNPVTATPLPLPPPPPPPAPTPTYKCVSLTAAKITRTEHNFQATAAVTGGAVVTNYRYDFGDGKSQTSTATTVKHTYDKEGTYTAKLSVTVKVGNETKTVTAPACQVIVTVAPPPVVPPEVCPLNPSLPKDHPDCAPCPIPGKEQYPKGSPLCVSSQPVTELPTTGPMDLIAGGIAVSSLVGASYYWYVSRRDLMQAFLER